MTNWLKGITTWCVWSDQSPHVFDLWIAILEWMHWWHRRGLQLWFGESGRGRSADQSTFSLPPSFWTRPMIFPLATFCSMSTSLSFLRSNMFDSCSKLVAPVFVVICAYIWSCARTFGHRRCVVAQISALHRGTSSRRGRFARIPKQTHFILDE